MLKPITEIQLFILKNNLNDHQFLMMTSILKEILYLFNLRLTRNLKLYRLKKNNVFRSHYKKRVLISYVTKPFSLGITYEHSNINECYTAAEIFHDLGYCVDVVDQSKNIKVDYSKYEIVYGMGVMLENSFYSEGKIGQIKIFYATGCNPVYSNIRTTIKAREFYKKHKKLLLNSTRIIRQSQYAQLLLSNAVIVLGNEFVLNTYKECDPDGKERYYRLNAFYDDVYNIDLEKKDYSIAGKHFLWFGSTGLLHKGLDILLDIFSQRTDAYLHICGNIKRENEFYNYYKEVIRISRNILCHDFVEIKSDEFKKVMDTCGYVLSPSVSEGGAVALLQTMANGGLVPIITKSSGLDLEEYGWILEGPEIECFGDAVDQAIKLNNNILKEKAVNVKKYIRENYTYEKYRNNLRNLIQKIIE